MLLDIENLTVEFHTDRGLLRAVDNISFSVKEGTTLGIVGESGCGKSVTAMSLLRLLPSPPAKISAGQIMFQGRDLQGLSAEEMRLLRGSGISMIFQEPMTCLNPVFTVGFQIAEAIWAHEPKLTKSELRTRVIQLLDRVGIPDANGRFEAYPHELSGGMRQRVMIAMALSCRPKLLIADEPTTALDVTIQAQILELIQHLQKEFGMAVMLISHDLGVISETADDVVVMYAGKIVEKASAEKLFSEPLHPYTRGLLASLPGVTGETAGGRLKGIPGMVPSPLNFPKGCRFHDRCDLVVPHCKEKEPTLDRKREGHEASCFEVR